MFFLIETAEAAERGDVAAIERWFETSDADVDATREDDYGSWTLLHHAAAGGHCGVIRALLRRSPDVHAVADNGPRPLHFACLNGHCRAADLLLDAGSDANARGLGRAGDLTALSSAARRGRYALCRVLLRRGADPRVADGNGHDAESYASLPRDRRCVGLLADFRRAGYDWRAYLREPRQRLLALRALVHAGRAAPPGDDALLARVFGGAARRAVGRSGTRSFTRSRRIVRTALPKELVWVVLAFWRSTRDDSDPPTSE